MIRRVFDPNVHGCFTWPRSWAGEVDAALDHMGRVLEARHPKAIAVVGVSAVYAIRDDLIVGVAWVEPEVCEGRVVGLERFIGMMAGSA